MEKSDHFLPRVMFFQTSGAIRTIPSMDTRASVLEFHSVAGVETSCELKQYTRIDSLAHLQDFLDNGTTTSNERRLYLVETAIDKTTFPKLESILSAKLGMSGDIFKRHQWSQTTFRFNETINCPRLPTTTRPRTSFSLEYFELWHVNNTNNEIFDHHNPSTVECASTGRQIQCYKWMKSRKRGWLLVASRKCSFWSRQDGDGWKGKSGN